MGVIVDFVARKGGKCCAVVYYDCGVLKTVYGYEIFIQIVLEMKKSPLHNFLRKSEVPSKF